MEYGFEKLEIYEIAKALVLEIYKITLNFPKEEIFGLTSQVKRASVSIVLNIAEGSGRNSKKDFARFINQAVGSLFETKASLCLGIDLGYVNIKETSNLFGKVDILFMKLIAFRNSLIKR